MVILEGERFFCFGQSPGFSYDHDVENENGHWYHAVHEQLSYPGVDGPGRVHATDGHVRTKGAIH